MNKNTKDIIVTIQNKDEPIILVKDVDKDQHFAEILFNHRKTFEKNGFEGFTEYQEADKDYFTHDICEYITDTKEENDKIITTITIVDRTITVIEYLNNEYVCYKVYDIEWDVDDIDGDVDSKEIIKNLPNELIVKASKNIDNEEIDDYISDYITNETGFTHKGFNYTECENWSDLDEDDR